MKPFDLILLNLRPLMTGLIVYLLDVLVVVVHISHSNCWITYYCTRIEVSVLRAGRGRGGGGGGGGWKFVSN